MVKLTAIVLACGLLCGLLSACSSTEVVAPTVSVSIGQQLMDLKKAKDSGALSDSEWQKQKEKLIDSVL